MSTKNLSVRDILKQNSDVHLKNITDKLNAVYPEEKGLSPRDEYLADLSAQKLREEMLKIKQQNLGSQPLVKAVCLFHGRQAKDQNSYRALTDVLTQQALSKAKSLDVQVTPFNAEEFPLYGYIISVKDCIRIKGQISSCGLFCNLEKQPKETPFVDYIERCGAVVISRSNVPQLLFAMESTNNVFGAVSNPWNIDRSAGGSSGGDAALVALGHVNSALGSDIAGSLRIPAFFCGISSLNITASRIDSSAHAESLEFLDYSDKLPDKQFLISVTIGPLAKTVEDVQKFAEVLVNYCNFNPRIAPIPWNRNPPMPTRVGLVVEWDNLFALTETNRRAMDLAVGALKANGIQVVEIDMRPYIIKLIQYIVAIFLKNRLIVETMKGEIEIGEPLVPPYENFVKLLKMPGFMVSSARKVISDVKKKIYMNALVQSKKQSGVFIMGKIAEIKRGLLSQMKEAGVEILLCPGMMPAIIKDTSKDINIWAAYMFVWNGLNFCSGAVPVARVTKQEQHYESKFNYEFEHCMRKNMASAEGLPVGVQIVGLPWRDEQVVEVMKIIEQNIAFK